MTAKNITEKEVQAQVCEWLHEQGYFFWRSNNTPIFDVRKKLYRAMPKYTPKGLPDIIVLFDGLFIGVEIKAPRKYWKLTPEQQNIKELITRNGGRYHAVTALDDLQLIFTSIYNKHE